MINPAPVFGRFPAPWGPRRAPKALGRVPVRNTVQVAPKISPGDQFQVPFVGTLCFWDRPGSGLKVLRKETQWIAKMPKNKSDKQMVKTDKQIQETGGLLQTPRDSQCMYWVPEDSLAGFSGSHGGVLGAPGARESLQKCGGRLPPHF